MYAFDGPLLLMLAALFVWLVIGELAEWPCVKLTPELSQEFDPLWYASPPPWTGSAALCIPACIDICTGPCGCPCMPPWIALCMEPCMAPCVALCIGACMVCCRALLVTGLDGLYPVCCISTAAANEAAGWGMAPVKELLEVCTPDGCEVEKWVRPRAAGGSK